MATALRDSTERANLFGDVPALLGSARRDAQRARERALGLSMVAGALLALWGLFELLLQLGARRRGKSKQARLLLSGRSTSKITLDRPP